MKSLNRQKSINSSEHLKNKTKRLKKFWQNKTNIILSIVIVILTITMLFYENQKTGFNEDEIFSYGSSNYKYDNLFQHMGKWMLLIKL